MVREPLEFAKMSGSGNDFVVADNRTGLWSVLDLSALARGLCRRSLSVGADGLILIENSKRARFKMRHYNPDGTEPSMCGNGARCAARFAFLKVIAGRQMNLETRSGVLQAEVLQDNQVRVEMPVRLAPPKEMRLEVEGRSLSGYLADSGVPHFVVFVKDIERAPVASLGPRLRSHPSLGPEGANVDFVSLAPGGEAVPMRTFERGVERETLACGTGATAVAWVLHNLGERPAEVALRVRSGRVLKVVIGKGKGRVSVSLTGEAAVVYYGKLSPEALEEALEC